MNRVLKSHLRSLLSAEFFGDNGVKTVRAPAADTLTVLIDIDCLTHFAEQDDLHVVRFSYIDKAAAITRERVLRDYIHNNGMPGIHYAQRGCTLFLFKTEDAYG